MQWRERIELERAYSAAESSKLWRDYDTLLLNARQYQKSTKFWRFAVVLAGLWLTFGALAGVDLRESDQVLARSLGNGFWVAVICTLLSNRPKTPKEPSETRPRTIVQCDTCSQNLRVHVGKAGKIRCPICQSLSFAST
jgi:hypothetical protein